MPRNMSTVAHNHCIRLPHETRLTILIPDIPTKNRAPGAFEPSSLNGRLCKPGQILTPLLNHQRHIRVSIHIFHGSQTGLGGLDHC
jgi:hypothetical protein